MKKYLFLFYFLYLIIPYNVFAFDNYIVMDMNSKRVFFEKGADVVKLPASTTKIMTAIVAIENNSLDSVATVKDEILTIDGSNIYVEMGEHMLVLDLLYGTLMRSGNDAAMVLARHTSGSVPNFVKLMNEKASLLGLRNTKFNNPTGLDDFEKNYTTVRDLATIYSYAYNNETFRKIIGTLEYETSSDKKSYYFINRSKILNMDDRITGAKTGYTPLAGRVLVSSASSENLDIVISSIGSSYGYDEHISLYDKIFSNYKNYLILDKNSFKTSIDNAYIKSSFYYPLKEDEKDCITKKIILNGNKEGTIGEILIYLKDDLIHKQNIYLDKEFSFKNLIKDFFCKMFNT